jgi:hypothetical protein
MKRFFGWLALASWFGVSALEAANPVPVPPAITSHREVVRHPVRPAAVQLQYSIGEPTDDEQLFLEYLNRARANPAAEGQRLAASTAADIRQAFDVYQVDLAKLQADLATNAPAPPLAFEPRLLQSARGHTAWMLNHAWQAHEETDPVGDLEHITNTTFDRIVAAGYDYADAGENVYAYADGVEYGHAGFEVDWGFGPGGVQEELGHRNSNHNPHFTEVGIGILNGSRTGTAIVQSGGTNIVVTNTVGPQVITVDFGSRFDQPALVTGVAHFDLNGNQFYDAGEGLAGVRVDIDSGSTFAVTSASGGYAVPAVEGTQIVTFSGAGMAPVAKVVTIAGGANAKLDLRLPYTAPVVTPPSAVYSGVPNVFNCTAVPLADTYQLESGTLATFSTVIDPKNGLGSFQPQVTTNAGVPAYSLILGDFATATLGFHLASASQDPQRLVLGNRLRVGATGQLSFGSELAVAGTNQYARVEISSDGGATWTKLWEQRGREINNAATIEQRFTTRTVSLAAYAGWECLFRFSYVIDFGAAGSGGYQAGTGKESGFLFNAVAFTGVDQLTPFPTNSAPSNRFAVTPSANGSQYLRVRPRVGARSFPAGPIAAYTVGTPPALVHLTNTISGSGSVETFPAGGTYAKGATVTLTPTPAANWKFAGWSGGASGSNSPLSLTLAADTKVTATFAPITVAVNPLVNGNGTIGVSPVGGPYQQGSQITLTATPAPGWSFQGWSGSVSGSANPLITTLTGETTVVATFVPSQVTLNVSTNGTGLVEVAPAGGSYPVGTPVTLTATPAAGWIFSGWSGDATGTTNPLALTLKTNTVVTATFSPATVALTTAVSGSGTVVLSPPGGNYPPGTVVTLTATPASGFGFSGWSGGASGTANPLALTVLTNTAVTATFAAALPPVVQLGGLTAGTNGTLSLGFEITQGSGAVIRLESAASVAGAWAVLSVPLHTNSPGHFSFEPITPAGNAAFYRVRVE